MHAGRTPALLAVLLVACGGGASSRKDLGPADVPAEGDAGAAWIDTSLSAKTVSAGHDLVVTCTGQGMDPAKAGILVRRLEKPVAAGDAAAGAGDDVAGPGDASWPPDTTLPEGVSVTEHVVRFGRTGSYTVACWSESAGVADPEPSGVTVTAAPAVRVETAVTPKSIVAGDWVEVTCQAWDTFNNVVEPAFVVAVEPADGVSVSGMALQLTRAVPHQLACRVASTGVVDTSPETVEVAAGQPRKIRTTVVPDTFPAGGTAEVTCTPLDAWDNPVGGLPVSVYKPEGLTLTGKTVTTERKGVYPVKCVPQTVEWKYFQLNPVDVKVTPADPEVLTLKAIPDKPFYGVGEILTVTATAEDRFHNLVENAELALPLIAPAGNGIVPSPQNPKSVFTLKAEGIYDITFRLAAWPAVFAALEVKVDGQGPLLTLTYPDRGATLQGKKPSVTVTGMVNDDVTGIKAVTVNGAAVLPDADGSFSTVITPAQGLNVIVAEVEDGSGKKARTTRGFYFSTSYYPAGGPDPKTGAVPNGALLFLSRDFFDDGDHAPPPDDVATLLEMVLAKLNIGALIPSPVAEADPYKVYIQNVTIGPPALQIHVMDGGMTLFIDIPDLRMDVKLIGTCGFLGIDFCPDLSGTVSIGNVRVMTDLLVSMNAAGQVDATLSNVQVQLGSVQVDIDGLIGSLFGWLVDLLVDTFTKQIQDAIESQIAGLAEGLIESLFAQFQINQTFEIPALPGGAPTALTLNTWLRSFAFQAVGVSMGMDGAFSGTLGVSHPVLGSIARADCLAYKPPSPFALPRTSELEVGLFDDLLNELVFALWRTGAINLVLTDKDLGGVDLSQYALSDLNVKLDFFLPPILSDCGPLKRLQVEVGDLYADVDVKFNDVPLHIGAFVQAAASVSLAAVEKDGHKEIGFTFVDLDLLEIEVVSINEEMKGVEDVLIGLLKDQVLAKALPDLKGKTLVSFAIPPIELSSLLPSLPTGLSLSLAIENLYREKGYTVAKGHLE